MQQLIQPNTNASGRIGWCEEFAERAWGSSSKRLTAIAGWNAIPAQYKHAGEPPTDVAVQLYWTYQNAGHTATNVPNQGILSSPWKLGTVRAWLPNRAKLEEIYSDNGQYPLHYLGWTEYFNGVLVAQGDDMSTIGDFEARLIAKYVYGYTDELAIEGAVGGLLGVETNTGLRRAAASETVVAYEKYLADLKLAAAAGAGANFVPVTEQLFKKG